MNKAGLIGGFIGLILGIVLIIIMFQHGPFNGEETNCYDEHNNRIIGERCIVENAFDNQEESLFFSIPLTILFIVFGYFISYLTWSFK